MDLSKKVEVLNKYCDGTLSITYYQKWELNSYKKGSFFSCTGKIVNLQRETFEELIDEAYNLYLK